MNNYGTVFVNNSGNWENNQNGINAFNNYGSFYFNISNSSSFSIGIEWNNYGYAELQTGTLYLSGGSSSTESSLLIQYPSIFQINAGSNVFNASVNITGTGTIINNAGSNQYYAFVSIPIFEVVGGTTLISNQFAVTSIIIVEPDSTLQIADNATVIGFATLYHNGGTITGGTLNIAAGATIVFSDSNNYCDGYYYCNLNQQLSDIVVNVFGTAIFHLYVNDH
jgi:hypothetical protein